MQSTALAPAQPSKPCLPNAQIESALKHDTKDADFLRPGELVTTAEAAAILGCSVATLYNARCLKKGPPSIKVGTMVRYIRSRLTEWVA
jgi:predicted DNA-binding transcriptional regulator AlpA